MEMAEAYIMDSAVRPKGASACGRRDEIIVGDGLGSY